MSAAILSVSSKVGTIEATQLRGTGNPVVRGTGIALFDPFTFELAAT
jgi:hypothetical protein